MRKLDGKIMIGISELAKLAFYAELKEEFRELIREKIYKKFGSLKEFSLQTKIIQSCCLSGILAEHWYPKLSL